MTWNKSLLVCRVCDNIFELECSWEGNYMTEQSGWCKTCGLYGYEYMTGYSGYWLWPFGQHADLVQGYFEPSTREWTIDGEELIYDIKLWILRKYWNWIGKYRKENE